VDGGPHDLGAYGPALCDELDQLLGAKVPEAAPQPGVGGERCLRLHPGEPLDRRYGGSICPLEQHLARQQRAVQRPWTEHLRCGLPWHDAAP
jgi:hypothetical protein